MLELLFNPNLPDTVFLSNNIEAGRKDGNVVTAQLTADGKDRIGTRKIYLVRNSYDRNAFGNVCVTQFIVHPFEPFADKVPDIVHFGCIATLNFRILVNVPVHNGPTPEVKLLRKLQFLFE